MVVVVVVDVVVVTVVRMGRFRWVVVAVAATTGSIIPSSAVTAATTGVAVMDEVLW
jgi:hypothetical protein